MLADIPDELVACKDYLDYIYVNEIGELVKLNFLTQHFETVLKKNGLKKIRFHDLRHSCASLLYANGVSLKEIQEWLGHSDIGTTSNIYTHLDYSSKASSANAILACYPTAAKEQNRAEKGPEAVRFRAFFQLPVAGLEPARITPPHFECGTSTNSITPAF